VGVLLICVLVFIVFCIVRTEFFVLFGLCILCLFVLSVLVYGLLSPSDNSISNNNNNNNNNNNKVIVSEKAFKNGVTVPLTHDKSWTLKYIRTIQNNNLLSLMISLIS
jgi:hypothetical protein